MERDFFTKGRIAPSLTMHIKLFFGFDFDIAVFQHYFYFGAAGNFASNNLLAEDIFNSMYYQTFQRARAKCRVKACACKVGHSFVAGGKRNFKLFLQAVAQLFKDEFDNILNLFLPCKALNTTISSTRFKNSGRKKRISMFCTSSRVTSPFFCIISAEPRLLVIIISVFLKSTMRPCPSVRRPSSSTCKSTLNTSAWAFSISSSKITLYGWRRTASVSWPPSS